MNKDQVVGFAKDVVGIVQQRAGKLIGSQEQQLKGLQKQVTGTLQKNVGDAKQYIKDQA